MPPEVNPWNYSLLISETVITIPLTPNYGLPQVRSTAIALFLFLMNLVGGNLPVIVAPLRAYFGEYR